MKAVLFANGEINDYFFCNQYLKNTDFIICCDGGVRHARALGIKPNYILGDFDSANSADLEYYKSAGVEFRQFPSRKDETDMELGFGFAVELGANEIIIIGGIGSRLDHTMANCHLLYAALKKNICAMLVNEKNCVRLVDKHCSLDGKKGDLVSLLSMTLESKGINLTNFEYPLINATLPLESPRGISNVMLGSNAEVSVEEGILFVIQARD